MDKIKVTLENWMGEVNFMADLEKIEEFNNYCEYQGIDDEELSEDTDYNVDIRTFGADPYLFFEPEGKFIVISQYDIDSSHDSSYNGYHVEFFNCECPNELESFLHKGWFFFDEDGIHITNNDLRQSLFNSSENGDAIIDNAGDGCVRFKNWELILELFKKYI